jgi:hypothetical protein
MEAGLKITSPAITDVSVPASSSLPPTPAQSSTSTSTTVSIEIKLLGKSLEFSEGDSCKLVEHAIRSQNNMRGGALSKDDQIYLGSTLFLPGTYVFIGGKVCQNPGEGWAKKKGAKCPCC